MPNLSVKINAFNGGEISDEVQGRTDTGKYATGVKRAENFILRPEGGAHRRSGSQFVAEAFDSTVKSRQIPFVFSEEQAYTLELSDIIIRVYADELQVASPIQTVAISITSPLREIIRASGHSYIDQQGPIHFVTPSSLPAELSLDTDYWVSLPKTVSFDKTDVVTSTDIIDTTVAHEYQDEMGPFRLTTDELMPVPLQGEQDYFIEVIDSTHIKLSLTAGGSAINITVQGEGTSTLTPTPDYLREKFRFSATQGGAPINPTSSGGVSLFVEPNPNGTPVGFALEIASPYLEAELYELQFAQSADVLFITHKNHEPMKLSRTGDTTWALDPQDIRDGPYLPVNTDLDEKLRPVAVTGYTQINRVGVLNWSTSDIGKWVRINHGGQWGYFKIQQVDLANNFALGLVGSDFGDTTQQTEWHIGSWADGNWPTSISFFEQRLGFGGEAETPQTLHGSQTSAFDQMGPSDLDAQVVASNAVNFSIGINQVNAIRWLALGSRLVIGTSSALLVARGSFDGEPIAPDNIQVQRVTAVGALAVPPVNISDQVVYLTANSQSLRSFKLSLDSDPIVPTDVTLLAKHIFGRTLTVTNMAYQQDRQSVLWCVRSDGVLAAVTFVPEHQVFAWHQHFIGGNFGSGTAKTFADTDVNTTTDIITLTAHGYRTRQGPFTMTTSGTLPAGLAVVTNYYIEKIDADTFKLRLTPDDTAIDLTSQGTGTHTITESGPAVVESVAVIPNPTNTHDQVWLTVKRTVNGATVRHVEFFEDEWLSGIDTEQRYVDSAPLAFSGSPVSTITGLDHLEGETVQVLADGEVHPDRVVSSGSITLDASYSDVLVGLGYVSELETLNLEPQDERGGSMGKMARIHEVNLRVFESRTGEIGVDLDNMIPIAHPDSSTTTTGDIQVSIAGGHRRAKSFIVRQNKPVSFNVLAANVSMTTGTR